MDKHLKALAPVHLNTKFIKLDAEVSKHSLFCTLDIETNYYLVPAAECPIFCDEIGS